MQVIQSCPFRCPEAWTQLNYRLPTFSQPSTPGCPECTIPSPYNQLHLILRPSTSICVFTLALYLYKHVFFPLNLPSLLNSFKLPPISSLNFSPTRPSAKRFWKKKKKAHFNFQFCLFILHLNQAQEEPRKTISRYSVS